MCPPPWHSTQGRGPSGGHTSDASALEKCQCGMLGTVPLIATEGGLGLGEGCGGAGFGHCLEG